MSSPQLIQNPLIPSALDGSLSPGNRTDTFQIDLRSFSSSSARLSLTNLSDDVNLKVLRNSTVLASSENTGKLSESILLGSQQNLLAPDLYTIEVTLAEGTSNATYTLNVLAKAEADLSNIWWRNSAAAQAAIWRMNGINIAGTELYSQLPAEWEIQGVEDLDGDGEDDLLWRNMKSGDVAYWLFKDGQRVSTGISFGAPIPLDWKIVAVKDLDGDLNADLVWHNPQAGLIGLWTLKAGALISSSTINVGASWQPLAPAYLDADTKADFVLRNSVGGQIAFWKLNGTVIEEGTIVNTGPTWIPQFYGDFNGDLQDDILLRDTNSGAIAFWQMDGVTIKNSWLTGAISQEWQIESIGNFDGTANGGNADLLWRNRRTGEMGIWLFNSQGTGFTKQAGITLNSAAYNKGADWTIAGVGDFNNDGKADILYRNEQQGLVEVLLMDGTTITDIQSYSGIGVGWKVRGIMERNVSSEPFDISDRTSVGGFASALAFDMGTLEGRGTYKNDVRSGFDDYFKFTIPVKSNIRLELFDSPSVQFALFPILSDGSLGSALTYSKDMALELGSYAVRVFTTTGTPTNYELRVFGQPESTDIATAGLTTTVTTVNLNPSGQNQTPNVITATFKVKNNSSTAISDIEVGFVISRDGVIDLDTGTTDTRLEFLGSTAPDKTILKIATPLDPGEEREFQDIQLLLPNTDASFWFVDGEYTIGLVVDPNNRLTEDDETNNFNGALGTDRVTLEILDTDTIAIVGSQMTLISNPSTFAPDGIVTVEFTLQNQGNRSSPNGVGIPIQFLLSTDTVITQQGAEGGDRTAMVVEDSDLFSSYIVSRPLDPNNPVPVPALGGKNGAGGVSNTFTFMVDLKLPSADWSGWTDGSTTFYLASWIDPLNNSVPLDDPLDNKLNPETAEDTLGKNYLKFTLS
ncbi:CARDB domain-containing protein [Leptolyngbya boryana CZ1]|uniref:CARDB domain-containing protein n=1 Tax=Leptolyngbya boryana CZ1 TaxID=3060204 RepID=A0AA96WSD6_LEPBY|nr:CARDB domain-containing protein [Leptolyngbya boryana]WNZ45106.1 CARDB domain-containing protein [Leptolyngbya boryana CZ1]